MKDDEKLMNCFRLKVTKETQQPNIKGDPELDLVLQENKVL